MITAQPGRPEADPSPDDQEIIMTRWRTETKGDGELLAFSVNGTATRSLGWLRAPGGDPIFRAGLTQQVRACSSPRLGNVYDVGDGGILGAAKPAGR
jgi:hypothetical protein